ncbi:MAG: hypothetical protein WDN47_03270 [Candidatus Doudnabacteria bacterium]
MKVWIQCRTVADAEFFVQAVIEGYFGDPLACQISPLNPCSVDVNFHSHPLDDEKIRIISFLVDWDRYEDESCIDERHIVKTSLLLPPDLRRGVLLPMQERKKTN